MAADIQERLRQLVLPEERELRKERIRYALTEVGREAQRRRQVEEAIEEGIKEGRYPEGTKLEDFDNPFGIINEGVRRLPHSLRPPESKSES